jgi:23S rRNA (adenine2030-N6)-methyltransferase
MARASRYRPGGAPDYSHRFHAGNVGDVWKHCVLVDVLGRAAAGARRVAYLDTHAGEGRYPLEATGEWSEGIGRLGGDRGDAPEAVARCLAVCDRLRGRRPASYPGSPAFAAAVLGPAARLTLWERDAQACVGLRGVVADDPRVTVIHDDGLEGLDDRVRVAEASADAVVVLIDPPWTDKADWHRLPGALVSAARASRRAHLVLWYPVKSLTRPNAMAAAIAAAAVDAVLGELITTPLEHQRKRLNGSGVILVRPPRGSVEALAAAASALGARCATTPGAWSFRMRALGGASAGR